MQLRHLDQREKEWFMMTWNVLITWKISMLDMFLSGQSLLLSLLPLFCFLFLPLLLSLFIRHSFLTSINNLRLSNPITSFSFGTDWPSPSNYFMWLIRILVPWHFVVDGWIDLDKAATWWHWRICVRKESLLHTLHFVTSKEVTQPSLNIPSSWDLLARKWFPGVMITKTRTMASDELMLGLQWSIGMNLY